MTRAERVRLRPRPPLVLLTGASGWFGRCLLESRHGMGSDARLWAELGSPPIRALVEAREDRRPVERAGAECVVGDVRSRHDCERFVEGANGAVLVHAAGVIHPTLRRDFYEVNVTGTRNVLAACERAGVEHAIVLSSNSPCGCNPAPEHRFDEFSPYNPFRHYGRSKMLMEIESLHRHAEGGLRVTVIRAPWFYGPYQPERQSRFFRMVRDGRFPLFGRGENVRSMVYLENLCQGILRAALSPRSSGCIYWIADERAYPMATIVDVVERVLEEDFGIRCAGRRLRLPRLAAHVAGALDRAVQAAGLYEPRIHVLGELDKSIACSIERARKELGYAPRVELPEGIRQSVAWLLENRGGL